MAIKVTCERCGDGREFLTDALRMHLMDKHGLARADAEREAWAAGEAALAPVRERAEQRARGMTVTELDGDEEISRDSGSLITWRRFAVQREGGQRHIVRVRVSWDSGTPQEEVCDCKGFRFHGECSHIVAVYNSGLLRGWE